MVVGGTDARFFRGIGATAYGYGMYSRKMTFEQFGTMFHGDDERIDVDSVGLSVELWEDVCRDLLA
jgi:acetylornithine deacetylase/succinyl-diaminopimelate desuccinylase-like protein